MIVHDFYIDRSWRAIRPLETDPPLIIDPHAVLAFAVALQRFEPIARKRREIPDRRGGFQLIQLQFGLSGETRECFYELALGELPGALVAKAHDHARTLHLVSRYVKRNERPFWEGRFKVTRTPAGLYFCRAPYPDNRSDRS